MLREMPKSAGLVKAVNGTLTDTYQGRGCVRWGALTDVAVAVAVRASATLMPHASTAAAFRERARAPHRLEHLQFSETVQRRSPSVASALQSH